MQTETETRLTRACLPEGPAREDLPHGREPLLTPSLWSRGCRGSRGSAFHNPLWLLRTGGGSVGAQLVPLAPPSPFRNLSDDSSPN